MYETILSLNESDSVEQGRIMNQSVSGLVIELDDGSTTDVSSIDDLDDILISASLKRDENRQVMNNCRLSDLVKVSMFNGGQKFDADEGLFRAYVDFGNIKVRNSDVLQVQVNNSVSFDDMTMTIGALTLEDGPERIKQYETLNAGGDNQQIRDCLAIFSCDDFTGNASINDDDDSIQMTADEAKMVLESLEDVNRIGEFGVVWTDRYSEGQNVTAVLPSGSYLITSVL